MSWLRRPRARLALAVWIALVAVLAAIVARSHFTADMSVFLPREPTPEQRLLVEQLREGMVSRLILVGVEGGDAQARAETSRRLAASLRADTRFASVNNGETTHLQADQRWLFDNRYALSPRMTPAHFSEAGLRTALQDTLDFLASPAGLLAKPLVTRDPTGEMMGLLQGLASGGQPQRDEHGVWTSRDGDTALLVLLTRASGADIDAQEAAMAAVRAAFDAARAPQSPIAGGALKLEMTGPGVFSVESRDTIKSEVSRIATLGTVLVVTLLLLVYRSPTVLLLSLLPMITGALAGIAAVGLGFGTVHGLTLGFGTTLIGEAVDYAIYLFVQGGSGREIRQFWPTIRLGLLTSIAGFVALFLSGFPGLAQLGVYSVAGITVAALTTRYLLPALLPESFRLRDVTPLGRRLAALAAASTRLRWLVPVLTIAALAVLVVKRDNLWNSELLALSPVPAAALELDLRLRAEMGAPDSRYLVVVNGADADAALRAAERLAPTLDALREQGVLDGWDSPARYLPSLATQQARLAAIPDRTELERRLNVAATGLPLSASRLTPFLDEAEAARNRPPLTRAGMEGTSLSMAVDAMLLSTGHGARALLPLRAPAANGHVVDAAKVRTALAQAGMAQAELAQAGEPLFLDLKHESDALYAGYLDEAIKLSLGGAAAVVLILLLFQRSPRQVWRACAPLVAAVLVVCAGLALAGEQLILLHLVGMLLIVAVGSNYTLFFAAEDGLPDPRTLASLLFATLTTVSGFGLLAISQVPVLHAIGITVGPGALLSLAFCAMLSPARRVGEQPA
ncbi:MMPL family transporter [Azoarcus sp. TTM-91]|uniref:MMPL family transporter n=1 Tax=Azoarcus sp. TTM-91 TaxID=2691581 RepID=UPI00145DB604|nr:MMPL family transporter [Azoarcus sp. TTM-91]NMG35499.1 MMPL family transporter [Azoarcus sp. TTM-91]